MAPVATIRWPNEAVVGGVLARLSEDLSRWLRRRIRCLATAMDIAAETVARAYRRFFFDLSPASVQPVWQVVWAWSLRVARNLATDHARAAQRTQVTGSPEEPLARPTAGDGKRDLGQVEVLCDMLMPQLERPEQETLRCLLAGVFDNEAIAALRGRRLRAVQESRRKIRAAAIEAWNRCRALHPRTSFLL